MGRIRPCRGSDPTADAARCDFPRLADAYLLANSCNYDPEVRLGDERTARYQMEREVRAFAALTISGGSELDAYGFPKIYKGFEMHSLVSSAAVQPTPVLLSYLSNFRPGAVVICSSSRHSISSCSSKLF